MFAKNKNSKELWIDTTKKFIVVWDNLNSSIIKWDILTLLSDDNSDTPFFSVKRTWKLYYERWSNLEYYEEFKRWDIVIDDYGDDLEFIADLLEEDSDGYRYVVKKDWEYYFSRMVLKKKELTEIEKAIELLTREWKIKDGKILV